MADIATQIARINARDISAEKKLELITELTTKAAEAKARKSQNFPEMGKLIFKKGNKYSHYDISRLYRIIGEGKEKTRYGHHEYWKIEFIDVPMEDQKKRPFIDVDNISGARACYKNNAIFVESAAKYLEVRDAYAGVNDAAAQIGITEARRKEEMEIANDKDRKALNDHWRALILEKTGVDVGGYIVRELKGRDDKAVRA